MRKNMIGENKSVIGHELVTVIVCCYNAAETVIETLQSLTSQSYKNIQIVIIDDGSTDLSVSLVRTWMRDDSRARLLQNDRNRGTAYARNLGIAEAASDFVMFFDADDVAEPQLVERLVSRFTEDRDIMAVSCYARYVSERGQLGIQCIGPTSRKEFFDLYERNKLMFLSGAATLIRREEAIRVGAYRVDILPNSESIRYEDFAEDLDLWCRMSDLGAFGRYFVTIPEPLFCYRKPIHSLSTRNVAVMQLKMRWIKSCLTQRRLGLAELTLSEFIRSRSWFERFEDWRSDIAAEFYKKAGFAYARRNYIVMGVLLCVVGLSSPKLIRQKLRSQSFSNENS